MQQQETAPSGGTGWGATIGTAIALQWAVIAGFAAAAGIWGWGAARSLLLGGAAVALPNAALALWLTLRRMQAGTLGVVAVLLGELLKLGLTIALLVMLVAQWQSQIVWIALVTGVIVALKAQWLALWFTRNY